jgi:hypothetical protein
MTPIEWNDSEPGFPDHLPPEKPSNPVVVALTRQEAEERIERVLEAAGISLDLFAVEGGVVDVIATFPDGATYTNNFAINILAEGYEIR